MDGSADPDFPLRGWRWRGVSDSAAKGLAYEQYPSCDFCDHQHLRYVHTLEHEIPPHRVLVGCVCAEDLTGDRANPKLEERKLRNLAARHRTLSTRREKFPFRRWTVVSGNVHWITYQGIRVGVIPRDNGGFWLKIDGVAGKLNF